MTVYVVQAFGTHAAALEKARFVKEGFSKPAFVFAQVWLLYHRLWIPLAIWIAAEIAYFVLVFPHVSGVASVAIDVVAHLYIGFEGNRLRIARHAAITDLVDARTRDEAETIFFRRQLAARQVDRAGMRA